MKTLLILAAIFAAGFITQSLLGDKPAERMGAEVRHIEIDSEAVGESLETSVVIPSDQHKKRDRPLLVFLHGRGVDNRWALRDQMFAGLSKTIAPAPIVAFPDGGDHSFWHDRADGAWARYVTDEVIPRLVEDFDIDRDAIAIGGISMGGYGALAIASHNPGRFCTVGAHSPALWRNGGESAAGAFDDAADFVRNDVMAVARNDSVRFKDVGWIDVGESDPFLMATKEFDASIDTHRHSFHAWPGGHENAYWDARWQTYFRFYAKTLNECRRDLDDRLNPHEGH